MQESTHILGLIDVKTEKPVMRIQQEEMMDRINKANDHNLKEINPILRHEFINMKLHYAIKKLLRKYEKVLITREELETQLKQDL